jgi:hypothetical protein
MAYFYSLAETITNLGESAVLISTAIAASGWFWLNRQRQLALLWLFAIGACAALMVVLKLSFMTCGQYVLEGTVRTPSGHSAMAALFYGAAALTIRKLSPRAAHHPFPLQTAALLVALAVGVSRVIVHAHTPQEVAVGLTVGFAWLALFARLLRTVEPSVATPPPGVLALLGGLYAGLLALTMAGQHMVVEGVLFQVAHALQVYWGVCTG